MRVNIEMRVNILSRRFSDDSIAHDHADKEEVESIENASISSKESVMSSTSLYTLSSDSSSEEWSLDCINWELYWMIIIDKRKTNVMNLKWLRIFFEICCY